MPQTLPKPPTEVLQEAEKLISSKLEEIGINVTALEAYEISAGMNCSVYPDGTLSYAWKGTLLLTIVPEQENGKTVWCFLS